MPFDKNRPATASSCDDEVCLCRDLPPLEERTEAAVTDLIHAVRLFSDQQVASVMMREMAALLAVGGVGHRSSDQSFGDNRSLISA